MAYFSYRIMTPQDGDLTLKYKTDDQADIARAMAKFDELVKGHRMWASTGTGAEQRLVKAFEPGVDVVFHRQVQGG